MLIVGTAITTLLLILVVMVIGAVIYGVAELLDRLAKWMERHAPAWARPPPPSSKPPSESSEEEGDDRALMYLALFLASRQLSSRDRRGSTSGNE